MVDKSPLTTFPIYRERGTPAVLRGWRICQTLLKKTGIICKRHLTLTDERCLILLDEKCHQIFHDEIQTEKVENDLECEATH
jgi:hypothetical protein